MELPRHVPVLVESVIGFLLSGRASSGQPHTTSEPRLYIDCTIGYGGHTEALLRAAKEPIKILGIDMDPAALDSVRKRFAAEPAVTVVRGNFREISRVTTDSGFSAVDGVLADFGQSSPQLDDPARGFSHRLAGLLDMRYESSQKMTAASIVNEWSYDELTRLLKDIGQERNARRIARAIVGARPLRSTVELAQLVRRVSPRDHIEKTLARVFMALRVAVNDELGSIRDFLPAAWSLLQPGSRLVCISYDSNQDRLVKDFFRGKLGNCTCPPELPVCVCGAQAEARLLTRRVVKPDTGELKRNPRSRSAKLRAAMKLI